MAKSFDADETTANVTEGGVASPHAAAPLAHNATAASQVDAGCTLATGGVNEIPMVG